MGQLVSSPKKNDNKIKENVSKEPAPIVNDKEALLRRYGKLLLEKGFLPDFLLVKERPSSKFIDEDGIEANEFYAEKVDEGNLRKLTRIHTNLKPKGKEPHPIPRLSADLPVVLLELPRSHC